MNNDKKCQKSRKSVLLGQILEHPRFGAGTLWIGALTVANGNCTQNPISVVKIFYRVFSMRIFNR